jgi:hypothetical protein
MTQRVHGGESAQEKNAAVPGLLRLLLHNLIRHEEEKARNPELPLPRRVVRSGRTT